MKNLELELHGQNEVNRIAKKEVENLVPQLKKFIGEKVYTTTGSRTSKFNYTFVTDAPQPKEGITKWAKKHNCYLQNTHGSLLWLELSICMQEGSNTCEYFKKQMCVGRVENQILVSVEDVEKLISDYDLNKFWNIEDVSAKISQYKELKKAAEAKKNELHGIDEFFIKY